jgi:hypothetical protein
MGHRASSDARPICAHVCVCVCIHENIACTHTHYASQWADGRCRQGGPGAVCDSVVRTPGAGLPKCPRVAGQKEVSCAGLRGRVHGRRGAPGGPGVGLSKVLVGVG